jgi:general secretion pathway protein I
VSRRGGPAGHGFTLLEVMVAMAILAMSLAAIFDVVGGALRNHERTRHLELATLLARGKLAEVEAKFEEDGFRDFDQTEEGTFDEEGHPEVAWSVIAVKPTVELGAEGVVKALTGADGGLEGLLGLTPGSLGGSGPTGASAGGAGGAPGGGAAALASSPMAAAALASIKVQLTALGEEIKKGVRQLRLTVSWKEGAAEEKFTVVTHLVVLVPGSQAAAAAGQPGVGPPGQVPNLPGFTQQPPAFNPDKLKSKFPGSDN